MTSNLWNVHHETTSYFSKYKPELLHRHKNIHRIGITAFSEHYNDWKYSHQSWNLTFRHTCLPDWGFWPDELVAVTAYGRLGMTFGREALLLLWNFCTDLFSAELLGLGFGSCSWANGSGSVGLGRSRSFASSLRKSLIWWKRCHCHLLSKRGAGIISGKSVLTASFRTRLYCT